MTCAPFERRGRNEATAVPALNDAPLSIVVQNPFHDMLVLNAANAENHFTIDIFDLEGTILFHYENSNAATGTVVADASRWSAGIYFSRIQNGKSASVQKIMKH